jgi:hypothetical protein
VGYHPSARQETAIHSAGAAAGRGIPPNEWGDCARAATAQQGRIEFGRFAEQNRERRGEGKPETFDFLGFTHISGKNRLGRFTVRRKTIRKRMRAKLREIKQ